MKCWFCGREDVEPQPNKEHSKEVSDTQLYICLYCGAVYEQTFIDKFDMGRVITCGYLTKDLMKVL